MNLSGKGRRVETLAIRFLRDNGYLVHRTIRSAKPYRGRWVGNGNDVFSCVDLIAKKRGERMRWIQVTAGRDIGRKKNKLAIVPWDTQFESVEIWRWVGGEGQRTDGRTGLPRPRFFFQLYRLDKEFSRDNSDRIFIRDSSS